jgi:hypothetical protein
MRVSCEVSGISKIRGNAILKNVILLEIPEKGAGLSKIGQPGAPVIMALSGGCG